MNINRSRIRLTLILTALFVAVVPAVASAAPQGPWQVPATDLSAPAPNMVLPDVKIGPDGSAIAVWWKDDGANNSIQAATRLPGGAFGTAFDLSGPAENAVAPNVAIGSDGMAAVTWLRVDGPNRVVRAVTRTPGGSFGEPVNLSEAGQDALIPGSGSVLMAQSPGSGVATASSRPQPDPPAVRSAHRWTSRRPERTPVRRSRLVPTEQPPLSGSAPGLSRPQPDPPAVRSAHRWISPRAVRVRLGRRLRSDPIRRPLSPGVQARDATSSPLASSSLRPALRTARLTHRRISRTPAGLPEDNRS